MTAIVLVHGAFHGPSCWASVVSALDAAGVPAVAPELPFTGLVDDAAVARRAIDRVAVHGTVVVCGHSYGGRVVSRAASAHPAVGHLVYLAAVLNEDSFYDTGERGAEAATDPASLMSAVRTDERGREAVDPDLAVPLLYQDVPAEIASGAVAELRPMAVGPMAPAAGGGAVVAAWHHIESTFVICTEDRSIDPKVQRVMARNADHVRELPTGHSPMLSRPDLVAGILVEIASGLDRDPPPVRT